MKKTLIAALALTALAVAQAEPATYAIDPTHTFATFEITHFATSTNRARFDKKTGSVTLDKTAKTGKVEITLDVTSVNSGTPAFNSHLKSDEIFATSQFPTATFVGDKFTFNGDKVSEVSGTLTLKGKANPVTLKASNFNCYASPMLNQREVCGGDFVATIDRTQWGVDYGLAYGFPKEVKLIIQIEAIKQ
jgi:polyisoprenoid-binding protein YceI